MSDFGYIMPAFGYIMPDFGYIMPDLGHIVPAFGDSVSRAHSYPKPLILAILLFFLPANHS
ncbi:MAG TPA: hypothetical protein VGK00_06815 [Anaerolineales bacterium]